jgi:DNA-binding NarL/FixJ family response regulator
MNSITLADATRQLVESVFALIRSHLKNPSLFNEAAQATLERARIAVVAAEAAQAQARESGEELPRVPIPRADLGQRIAELRAQGHGIRAIARRLAVQPSTVSRRLRKARDAQ